MFKFLQVLLLGTLCIAAVIAVYRLPGPDPKPVTVETLDTSMEDCKKAVYKFCVAVNAHRVNQLDLFCTVGSEIDCQNMKDTGRWPLNTHKLLRSLMKETHKLTPEL